MIAVKDIDRVGDGIDDGRKVSLRLHLEFQLLFFVLYLPFAYLILENITKDPDCNRCHYYHRQGDIDCHRHPFLKGIPPQESE